MNSCCRFNPQLESGTKYYGKVYVSLWAIPKGDYAKTYKTQFIRLKYDEFHLITPYMMLPFEYAFVVLVLVAIILAVCTIGKRYISKIYRKIGGFRMVSGEDEESDIDQKLEDYFLNNRSKFEEQFEEYKTSEGVTKNNTSQEEKPKELQEKKNSKPEAGMVTPQKKSKIAAVQPKKEINEKSKPIEEVKQKSAKKESAEKKSAEKKSSDKKIPEEVSEGVEEK